MKTSSALSVVLGLPWIASAAICNNNCGRAVAGTARQNPPFESRRAECAGYVSVTVTVTLEASATPVAGRNVRAKRQVTPQPPATGGPLPTYAASACRNAPAYWSACQCFSGITATTITVTETPVSSSGPIPTESSESFTSATTSSAESESATSVTEASSTEASSSTEEPSSTASTSCTTVLPSPTPISVCCDDNSTSVELPFPVGVFGAYSETVYVSVNGRLSINISNSAYINNRLPDYALPPVSILAYYDDLTFSSNSTDGVSYQVFGSSPSRNVTFQWRAQRFGQLDQYFHFTATFEEAAQGVVTFKYYETTQKGSSATVGAQNLQNLLNPLAIQYSYNTEGSIPDLSFVRLQTSGNGTFTDGTFDIPAC